MPAPSQPPAAAPIQTLTREQVSEWWRRVELARARRKQESDKWNALLQAYLPAESTAPDDIKSNIHFRNVELKRAELWAQLPELMLSPLEPLDGITDPQTGQPLDPGTIVSVKRAVLNKLLGRDHANVKRTIDEALFAIFASTGVGATKICYEVDTQDTDVPMPGPPQAMPGAVLNLQPVPSQTMQTVPVPVYERFRWYHFSEAKLLIPHDYHSTDFDEAPWLGMEFVMPLARAIKKYKLPPDFVANVSRDEMVLDAGKKDADPGSKTLFKGVELWLRASEYDETVAHSQLYYVLTLAEGLTDRPAEYRPSPYQTIGPDGRLTADSMIGNPIHPITLRYLSDSAYIPADSAFTDPLVKQINTWRSQSIKGRDANIPRFFHAMSITQAVDKLKMADVGQGVAVDDDLLKQFGDKLLVPIPKLERAESDVQGEATIRRDNDETLGIGSNQAGSITNTVRSATESAIVQQNVSVRLKSEQNQLLDAFLAGVRKFDALVQRYADTTAYVEIVGQNGAKTLAAWNQHVIAGRYAYDAKPDTQLTMDPQARIKKVLDFVNFMAKSQYMNQAELARIVTLEFGYDPGRLVVQPTPPPPEKPKLSMSLALTAADLAVPEVRQVMQIEGITLGPVSPELHAAAQAQALKNLPHGGAADHVEPISQHSADLTGHMDGRAPASVPMHGGVQ
jgi:hypothetical protein